MFFWKYVSRSLQRLIEIVFQKESEFAMNNFGANFSIVSYEC